LAADKRKILELARKLAQKNAKDKALAEYQKLLKLDPKDAKLRLEVGDAHRRWGQVDEAIDTYKRVAEQYMAEGFDARAVAVFKQILNLDPDRLEAYAPLAELYERMGLTAEALAALQTAADGYHRQGKKGEALDLLRKMANADPSNTRSRIKVADLLRQEGKKEDAIAEYLLAADELERQGDVEAMGGAFRRILELDERNVRALSALAQCLATRGKLAEAIPLAERALQLDDGNAERYEQLASLFERAKKLPEHERVQRRLAELYRSRGEESRARQILERFANVVALGNDAAEEDEFSPPADELKGGGLLGDETDATLFGDEFPDSAGAPEIAIDFGSELEIGPGASLSGGHRKPAATAESTRIVAHDVEEELLLEEVHEPAPAKPAITPDWEALLAEASVYLRYGKRDKAIAHLRRVVDANPNHRGALEKLGEAYAESGERGKAVEVWLRAALRAHEERDNEALRVLRGRIAVLDESAAAHIPKDVHTPVSGSTARPAAARHAEPEPDDLLLDDDELLEDDLSLGGDVEPEIDVEGSEVELEAEDSGLELGSDEHDVEIASDAPGLDLGSDDAELDLEADEPAPPRETPLDGSARQQVLDDLEEADFYMQQGLHDEAEVIYRRVLAAAPDHARALARLAEITEARGESAAPRAPVRELDFEADGDLTAPEEPVEEESCEEVEISVDISDDESGADPEPAATGADLDDFASLDLGDDEHETSAPSAESSGDGSDTEEFLRPASEAREREPMRASAPGDGGFDLAAALADAFDDDPNGSSGSRARPAGDDGFAAVFQAFKKGVRETLSEGDHQAHYDLAIAYKEMGLYDDAIYELRTAMADPNRTAECLHLIGLCAIDSDQAPLAIEHLEQLLALPGLVPDAALAGRFDLGRALEAVGDVDGARREWQAVAAHNPAFQSVGARLAGLAAPKPDPAEDPGFESFTDVIDGGEEPAEVRVGGETFDDLVAEANTGPGEPDPVLDAEPMLEPEAEPAAPIEPEPAPPRAPKPPPGPQRRKKKISFL
jgi:pilus assembly protein FimV